jgi:hypothetical protein
MIYNTVMPLAKVNIAPGFDKQSTPADAEGRWVDGDLDMVNLKK